MRAAIIEQNTVLGGSHRTVPLLGPRDSTLESFCVYHTLVEKEKIIEKRDLASFSIKTGISMKPKKRSLLLRGTRKKGLAKPSQGTIEGF